MKLNLTSGEVDLSGVPWDYSSGMVRNQRSGRQLPVRVAHLHGDHYQIWLAGQVFEVELASGGPRRAGADQQRTHEHSIEASMPGTVLAVKVQAGDEVVAGQVLVVMESMKMELSLESPRAGKVAQILVEPGQLVEMGSLLLDLEK